MNRVLTHTDPVCSRCNPSFRMALVLLISLILLSLGFAGADEDCVYAAVGTTKVIDHDYPGLELFEQSFHLRWTHDSTIVYDSKKDAANKYQTTKNGSLLLENLQLDNAGTYQATIYDSLGNHMKSTVTRLCLLAHVSKPRLTHTCDGTSVTLRCDVVNPGVVIIVWQHNGNTLPGQTDATLTITKATLKPEDSYACTASIKASEEKSDDVYPECTVAVSKPRLTHTCTDASVTLRCDVENPVNVNVTWSRNSNTLPGQTDATLTITKATLKPEDSYACTASIKASEEKSDDVYPECTDDDSSAVLLFGMELWLMVLILAGGGGLLLTLIIITLVCVCRSRRQHKRRLEEEEEMRLAPLTHPTR
ncbi:neural cell adhesion molecule 1-like [Salmo trutta]|uniref:Neural cell adhesion molecule 1-like n=1 Tax=Salmo trutta TaxID=8032 RepID=A0A673X0I1_SALTR|nr:neural cell adhesion molecule 1-like [Salmo trutta]